MSVLIVSDLNGALFLGVEEMGHDFLREELDIR